MIPRREQLKAGGDRRHTGGKSHGITGTLQCGDRLFQTLTGGVLDPGVIKTRRLSQSNMAKCGRLINGKAHGPGFILIAEIGVSVNTSCFDLLVHRMLPPQRILCSVLQKENARLLSSGEDEPNRP